MSNFYEDAKYAMGRKHFGVIQRAASDILCYSSVEITPERREFTEQMLIDIFMRGVGVGRERLAAIRAIRTAGGRG